jgi:hypothetical protein
VQGRVSVLHCPTVLRKPHNITASGVGEKWHTTSLHARPWLSPRIFSGCTFSCLLGRGRLTGSCIRTYLQSCSMESGDRWAMSESGSRATLISHVIATGHLRPFKGSSVMAGGHFRVYVGKFYFSVNSLRRWPGESSVLSASPAIGGLLLYSVYDSATSTFPFKKISDSFTC